MSRFAGFVKIRRGVIDHLVDGRLTPNEYFSFLQLVLMADAGTGGDVINAPLLLHRTGHMFNLDTAQRILTSLHSKKYIWYKAARFAKKARPYWVNRYELTKGPMKGRWTNLSQLFDKSSISQQEVWQLADQPTDYVTDETTDGNADKYKTRELKIEKKKTPVPSISTGVLQSNTQSNTQDSEQSNAQCELRSALHCSPLNVRPDDAHIDAQVMRTVSAHEWKWGDPAPDCDFNRDRGYWHKPSGKLLRSAADVIQIIEANVLTQN